MANIEFFVLSLSVKKNNNKKNTLQMLLKLLSLNHLLLWGT